VAEMVAAIMFRPRCLAGSSAREWEVRPHWVTVGSQVGGA